MNKVTQTAAAISIVLLVSSVGHPRVLHAQTPEQRGLQIAQEADKANEGWIGESAEMTMELINAHGDVIERKMSMKMLEGTTDGDKSVSTFHWPADVNGTRMLTWTHKKGNDDQWLYLPSIKRIKRISSRNQSGSFMGSEFAFEDLSGQEVEKFTYKYLADEQVGGRDTHKIERYPVNKDSGYSKQISWIDKEYHQPLKIEYYDRKGGLMKTAVFEGFVKFDKVWRIGKITMDNVQTKKKSVITWKDRKVGEKIPESEFESDSLE